MANFLSNHKNIRKAADPLHKRCPVTDLISSDTFKSSNTTTNDSDNSY